MLWTCPPVHQVWPKPSCNSQRNGEEDMADRNKWEDNIREWTGLEFTKSNRAVENRKKWRKLVVKSSVVPWRPLQLRDRWGKVRKNEWWLTMKCECEPHFTGNKHSNFQSGEKVRLEYISQVADAVTPWPVWRWPYIDQLILNTSCPVHHEGHIVEKHKSSNHKEQSHSLCTCHFTVEEDWGKMKLTEPRRQKF